MTDTPMPKGIHHLALRAKDFDASVAFYTGALGLKQVVTWGEGDGRGIMLDAGNGACVEIFAGGTAEAKPEGALLHFALRVDDTDAAFQRAVAAGATVNMAPETISVPSQPFPFTTRIAFVNGFDGEVIEFFQSEDI